MARWVLVGYAYPFYRCAYPNIQTYYLNENNVIFPVYAFIYSVYHVRVRSRSFFYAIKLERCSSVHVHADALLIRVHLCDSGRIHFWRLGMFQNAADDANARYQQATSHRLLHLRSSRVCSAGDIKQAGHISIHTAQAWYKKSSKTRFQRPPEPNWFGLSRRHAQPQYRVETHSKGPHIGKRSPCNLVEVDFNISGRSSRFHVSLSFHPISLHTLCVKACVRFDIIIRVNHCLLYVAFGRKPVVSTPLICDYDTLRLKDLLSYPRQCVRSAILHKTKAHSTRRHIEPHNPETQNSITAVITARWLALSSIFFFIIS